MEIITILVMLVISGICGIFATLYHNRLEKAAHKWENILLWIWYSFCDFLILNLYRCMMWKHDEIVVYSADTLMLITDMILAVLGAIICPYIYQVVISDKVKKGAICFYRLALVLIGLACVAAFVIQYPESRNIKVVMYQILLPGFWFVAGGVCLIFAFFISLLISILIKKNVESIACQSKGVSDNDARSKKQRIKDSQGAIFIYLITAWIYPFTETLMTNYSEWYFSIADIICNCLLFMFLLYGLLLLLFAHFKGLAWNILYITVFGFSIAAYAQTMFLNGKLFVMDGTKQAWNNGLKLGNLAVWIIVIGIVIVGMKLLKDKWKQVYNYVSYALICMQLIAIVSLLPQFFSEEENSKVLMENYLSTEGIYEVAAEENVILFVLDCFDVENMDAVLADDSSFLDSLEGFTYYPDTVSQFSRTLPSITYLLTQEEYYRDIPYENYLHNAFENCEFWDDIQEEGYTFQFYDADNVVGLNTKKQAGNFIEQGHSIEEEISFVGCIRAMMNIGHYRVLPYLWKNYQVYTAESINEHVVAKSVWDYPMYVADDAEIYAGLKNSGLSIGNYDKLFKHIHLTGAHNPYTLNEKGERVKESETSDVGHFKGCMQIVFEYLAELRRLGLYENTMIIITADHGENFMFEELKENTNPILFIKPAGVSEGELVVSDIYASQQDILYTVAKSLGLDSKLSGINLLDETQADSERVRYHYYDVVEGTRQMGIAPYEIRGSALDFENWTKTGEFKEFIY